MRREAPPRDRAGFADIVVRPGDGKPRGNRAQRVRPRRRRPKRGIWRGTMLPLLICAVVVTVGGLVIVKGQRPFRLYGREKDATAQLQRQLDECRRNNDMLARRIKYLQTSEGRAQAARELGWVKPGEITLVIPPDNQPKPPAPSRNASNNR